MDTITSVLETVFSFIFAIGVFALAIYLEIYTSRSKRNRWGMIDSTEYMKYSDFYDTKSQKETEASFREKTEKIYHLIIKEKCDDLELIAKESGCSYDECIIKINYLKHNNIISQDYYVDHINGYVKKCSKEDLKLMRKYSPYLYKHKLQIRDIAVKLPSATRDTIETHIEMVRKDIKYLLEKDLIEGVIYNEVDDLLIYYDDSRKGKDLININCPNCGALVELQRGGKVRCTYCNAIVEAEEEKIISKK